VIVLFSDRGCPFAHRVQAWLAFVGCPVDHRCAPVGEVPDGVERYAPSRPLPLLVDGDLVLTESRVMLEHLADRQGVVPWPGALRARTLQRHGAALVDTWLAPALFGRGSVAGPRLEDVLDALEVATAAVAPGAGVLAYHVAPIWLPFRWWHPGSPITHALASRPALVAWLDAAAALPAVVATWTDPTTHPEDLERARVAGLIDAGNTP